MRACHFKMRGGCGRERLTPSGSPISVTFCLKQAPSAPFVVRIVPEEPNLRASQVATNRLRHSRIQDEPPVIEVGEV